MNPPPHHLRYTFDFLNKGDIDYVFQHLNHLLEEGRYDDARAFEEEYTEDIDTETFSKML